MHISGPGTCVGAVGSAIAMAAASGARVREIVLVDRKSRPRPHLERAAAGLKETVSKYVSR